jgi:hypothetical protein
MHVAKRLDRFLVLEFRFLIVGSQFSVLGSQSPAWPTALGSSLSILTLAMRWPSTS